ncbi:MAG: hypothetical protein O3B72_04375 [Proteobacteria bacterium]|nr:hypothetical protein [Pseudomonadota bacterium]
MGEVSGGDGGDSLDGLTRMAEVAWLKPDKASQWIFEKLAAVVERANRVYEYDLLGFTEEAQFTCYRR